MSTPDPACPDYVVGILESWEYCDNSRYADMVISGETYNVKAGSIIYYTHQLPWSLGSWIVESLPENWPIGAKIRMLHGHINAIWLPEQGVWAKSKY